MGKKGDPFKALAELGRRKSLFRPKDVDAIGVSRAWMPIALILGTVRQVAPGIYGRRYDSYPEAAIAAARLPRGVACLTTALTLHGWADVPTLPVWWALPRTMRKPKRVPVEMRFIRLGPATFECDVERREFADVEVKVYSLERTLSDCMRWRTTLNPDPMSAWWLRVRDEARRLGIGERANRWRLIKPADRIAA
jgi:hypothetical protein